MLDLLIVERAGGRIRYPIRLATWNLYVEDPGEPDFCLRIETDLPIQEAGQPLRDDWWARNDQPFWEVNIIQPGLRTPAIVPGTQFSLPVGYDKSNRGVLTNILFDHVHQQSDKNTVSILEVDSDRLLVRMEGQTIEGTWHDGPITTHTYARLTAKAWFTRNLDQFRGFASFMD